MFGKNSYKLIVSLLVIAALGRGVLYAQVLDSDFDGLSDTAETSMYHTDKLNPDTDSDGVLDYKEILDKTDPNNPNDSTLIRARNDANRLFSTSDPLVWYTARVTGIAAFILFSIVVSFGLLMSSKSLLKWRFISAPTAFEVHKFIALVAFLFLVTHITTFFFDAVLRLNLREALIPFQINFSFKSALGYEFKNTVSLGIFAFYLSIIILLSSYFRKKIVSLKTWRAIHYSTFLFYALFLLHGFSSGTDSKEPWMRAIYIISLVIVLFLILLRMFGKKFFMPKPPIAPTSTVPPIPPVTPINTNASH